jgi:TRAP-type C4-dicarboxylate transport system substrate-binding protein
MNTTRRTFLKGTVAAAAASTLPAPAVLAQAPIELKLASFVPPTHSIWDKVLMPWVKRVEEMSKGQLKIAGYPSMQLGGKAPELYRQMVQGIADIVFTLPGYTSADFPMMSLTELPGTATSAKEGTERIWKRLEEGYFAKELADAKVLMLWNADNAGILTRNRLVRKIEDVKGLRLRSPSAAQALQIEHLGGVAVSLPVPQVYPGIERGTVDGAMIPVTTLLDFKLAEVVKYITTEAPLGRSAFIVSMQKKRYDSLPAELRKIIDTTTGLELALQGAKTYDDRAAEAMASVQKTHEIYLLSKDEYQQWLKFFAPLATAEAKRVDAAGLPGSKLVKSYDLI